MSCLYRSRVKTNLNRGDPSKKTFPRSSFVHWNETWRVTSQQLAEGYPRSTNSGGCRGNRGHWPPNGTCQNNDHIWRNSAPGPLEEEEKKRLAESELEKNSNKIGKNVSEKEELSSGIVVASQVGRQAQHAHPFSSACEIREAFSVNVISGNNCFEHPESALVPG
ncbi:hypothetical protein CEXT_734021 [Caerostris extrusa]|uniref:Uncharacterized protein n=1 Tax=Caerostris extrusa TaxID=172846 RepID=A0AAV4XGR1_CAEEX|nr:hypothetical protein CEXT_734021 [Caerostris extrusa]